MPPASNPRLSSFCAFLQLAFELLALADIAHVELNRRGGLPPNTGWRLTSVWMSRPSLVRRVRSSNRSTPRSRICSNAARIPGTVSHGLDLPQVAPHQFVPRITQELLRKGIDVRISPVAASTRTIPSRADSNKPAITGFGRAFALGDVFECHQDEPLLIRGPQAAGVQRQRSGARRASCGNSISMSFNPSEPLSSCSNNPRTSAANRTGRATTS